MKVNCNKCGEKLLGHVCVNPDCNAENVEFRITKKRKTRTLRGFKMVQNYVIEAKNGNRWEDFFVGFKTKKQAKAQLENKERLEIMFSATQLAIGTVNRIVKR